MAEPTPKPTTLPTPPRAAALPGPGAGVLPLGPLQSTGIVITPAHAILAVILLGLLGGLFHHWFYVQNFLSFNVEDWRHAYFVPFISLFLLWQNRRELARTQPRVFLPGLLPMLLGINAYLFFQLGAAVNHMAQGWSLILTVFGVLLFVGGPRLMQLLFLPLAYLLFAVAVSDPIMRGLTFRMQLMASEGGWALLNIIGMTCDLEGNVLQVTTEKYGIQPLNVAEACAGMRMVIGFIALGAAVALVATRAWWKRVALLGLALPVAVFMNMVRVAFLATLTTIDPKLAAGQSHMFMGTLILIAAFFVYMAFVWALNKAAPEDEPAGQDVKAAAFYVPGFSTLPRLARSIGFVVPALVLGSAAVAVPVSVWAMGVYLRKLPIYAPGGRAVSAVAPESASWIRIGKDAQESAEMLEELGTTNYLSRTYLRKDAPKDKPRAVDLHLAYYTGMIDTIPHIPERCMVGAGWQIVGATRAVPLTLDRTNWRPAPAAPGTSLPDAPLEFALTDRSFSDLGDAVRVRLPRMPGGVGIRVTEFTNPRTGTRLFAGYLFIANGTTTDSAESVRLLAFDLRDDYAYYLKVQFSSQTARTAEDLAADAGSLLSELIPEIMRCVPDWGDVESGLYPPDNPRSKSSTRSAASPK
ncbi:MAG: exosortase/archaeosortase family protein [Phycisphaerales bacterium]